jgi:hypothetical protein
MLTIPSPGELRSAANAKVAAENIAAEHYDAAAIGREPKAV